MQTITSQQREQLIQNSVISYITGKGIPLEDFIESLDAVEYGENILCDLAQEGNSQLIKDLASLYPASIGILVDKKKDGKTPLMIAVQDNNLEAVSALLEAGANPTILNDRRTNGALGMQKTINPEMAALLQGAIDKFAEKYLLEKFNIDVKAPDHEAKIHAVRENDGNRTILHKLVSQDLQPYVAGYLLEKYPTLDVNARDASGKTAIESAHEIGEHLSTSIIGKQTTLIPEGVRRTGIIKPASDYETLASSPPKIPAAKKAERSSAPSSTAITKQEDLATRIKSRMALKAEASPSKELPEKISAPTSKKLSPPPIARVTPTNPKSPSPILARDHITNKPRISSAPTKPSAARQKPAPETSHEFVGVKNQYGITPTTDFASLVKQRDRKYGPVSAEDVAAYQPRKASVQPAVIALASTPIAVTNLPKPPTTPTRIRSTSPATISLDLSDSPTAVSADMDFIGKKSLPIMTDKASGHLAATSDTAKSSTAPKSPSTSPRATSPAKALDSRPIWRY